MAESQGIEPDLRAQVEAAGGKQNPARQLRFVEYGTVAVTPQWKSIYM